MNEESFEKGGESLTSDYERYKELGGIINEKDFESALTRAQSATTLDERLITRAQNIAENARITLHNTENALDPRILYSVLRDDKWPEGAKYHHSDMSDEVIFFETLCMTGDKKGRENMLQQYPTLRKKYPTVRREMLRENPALRDKFDEDPDTKT
ncbi:MAG: hypothetical protein Q7S28_01250 [bacterium]|nr:hypothetical protein [bacterium]